MKKALKIIGITLGVILLILIILPFAFKGKITKIVENQANKMLNAEFYMENVGISLIKNFPNASVSIKNVAIIGNEPFAGDTLIYANRITATVNLKSLFGNSGFDIRQVGLSGALVNAIVLKDGAVNWDIMKPSEEVEEVEIEEESSFRILLKRVNLNDVEVRYDDREGNINAVLKDINLGATGDLSAKRTTLGLKGSIGSVSFRSGNLPLLANAKIEIRTKLDADMENSKYTLQDNQISLNAITLSLNGWVAMLNEGYDMDLNLATEKVGLKEILSLIPAVYSKEFKSLQASGAVELSAWAKGRMVGDNLPAFDAKLKVENGTFRYPSLPKGVEKINIFAAVANPGGNMDKTTIKVEPLSLSMAGNPFTAKLSVATPISDMNFSVGAKGVLDLATIEQIYPLDNMELNGLVNADFDLKGRMSYIEKNQYDRLSANGTLAISNMVVKMKDIPDVNIKRSLFTFTPQYLNLSETTVLLGKSDITADCRLENYIAYALKGEKIKGALNIKSKLIDLNEIMGNAPEEEEQQETQSEMSSPNIPSNIDFNMQLDVDKLKFGKLDLDRLNGRVMVKDSKLDMRNLSFNSLGGAIVANGYYSSADGVQNPELDAAFALKNISFRESFTAFDFIKSLVPIFEGMEGDFSGGIALNSRFDDKLKMKYNTMNGSGNLSTQNVKLSGVKSIDMIADAIKKPELKNMQVKNLDIAFTIKEGRVTTKPFDIKMGDVNMNISGSTGIDQTIDYVGSIKLPESTGIGKLTTVDLKIGGTFASPSVSLDTQAMVENIVSEVVSEAKEKVGDKISEILGVDIKDAEAQRTKLIEQAEKSGAKLVQAAEDGAEKLREEAGSSPLKKIAAEVSAKALVSEAKKQSDALVELATKEGDKLVEKANSER